MVLGKNKVTDSIKFDIVTDYDKVFESLHHGINLPVFEALRKHVINEISHLKANSIIMRNDWGEILGHTIVYDYEGVLYFGFFAIKNDIRSNCYFLIEELKNLASQRNCHIIRGPMNIPTTIYGWGFSEKDNDPTPFAMAPYNNPVYIDYFKEAGFYVWHRLLRLKIKLMKMPFRKKHDIWEPDFNDRDSWLPIFTDLQKRLYPPSSCLTPNRNDDTMNYMVDLIQDFGNEFLINFANNDEGKTIGLGYALPNVFDIDENSQCCSLVFYGGVIEKEYRKKGIITNMMMGFQRKSWANGITNGEWPIGDDNKGALKAGQSIGGKVTRSFSIMEIEI
ncbi:MAG: hypothetical protein GY870_13250 [archaeon]|nr:hypothetical protein [archaeon]